VAHLTRSSLGFYRESNAPALVSVTALLESSVELLRSKVKAKRATVLKDWDGDLHINAVGDIPAVLHNQGDAWNRPGTMGQQTNRRQTRRGHQGTLRYGWRA
jgi:hypothetical protein